MNTNHDERRDEGGEAELARLAELAEAALGENGGGQKPGEFMASDAGSEPDLLEISAGAGEKPGGLLATSQISAVDTNGHKGNKGGRPSVMDEKLKEQVCLLLSLGLSRRQAAAHSNIAHSTITNAMQREPEFAERVDRAEQMSIVKPMLTIANLSRKNWRAAVWLLARNERRLLKDDEELKQERAAKLQQGEEIASELLAIGKALNAPPETVRPRVGDKRR